MRLLLLLAIVAFTAPGLVVKAQQQQGPPGILRGTVIREDTSEPIRDVRISVGRGESGILVLEAVVLANLNLGDGGPALRLLQQTLNNIAQAPGGAANFAPQFSALTDSNGRFAIEGIPPGQYTVISQREGYFGSVVQPSLAALAVPAIAREAVTIASQQTASITLTMIPGATVSGRVLGPDGMPASNMAVELLRVGYPNGVRTLQIVNQKPSDDRGDYRLFQLPPGNYYLAVTSRSTVAALRGAGGNAPPQEMQVRTYYPNATEAMNAQPITLRPGDDLTGMNVQLQRLVGSKISGRVVSQLPANARNRATITLLPRDRGSFVDPRWTSGFTVNPNDGSFEIPDLPAGAYDLYASLPDPTGLGPAAPPGQATAPVAYGRTAIDVRGRDLADVTISVHQGTNVKGQVFVDGKAALAPVRVSFQPADSSAGIAVFNQVGRNPIPIQQDGSFQIPAVPEARYRVQPTILSTAEITTQNARIARGVRAGQVDAAGTPPPPMPEPLPATAYVADVRQGGASVYDDGISIGTSLVSPLEVLINTNGGAIEGTIIGAGQQTLAAGTVVVLVPPANRRQNPALYKTTSTDAEGSFTMSAVPPGPYKLFAWQSIPAGAHLNPDFVRKYEDRGVSIIVPAGATISQAVMVIPAEPTR